MKTSFICAAALALAAFSLAACKKDEPAPASNAPQQGPTEVAPVPVEQDGVFRYADESTVSGPAKTNAQVQARKGPDATSDVVASLEADAAVEKKSRRGEFTLVSWKAEAGQPATGWVPTSALVDQAPEPVILPVDAGTTATDAGTAADAGATTSTDAGTDSAKADDATDAGKAEETTSDAGESAKADDAGSSETAAEGDADKGQASADAGAGDGGTILHIPIKQRVPVLKLPGKLDVKKAE